MSVTSSREAVISGAVQVIYGTPLNGIGTGLTNKGNQLWTRSSVASTPTANDRFGAALAVGDFNHDGFTDLVVGAPGQGGAGAVYVFLGSRQGLKSAGYQLITQSTLGRVPHSGDNFGSALAVGDFNNDLRADLAVGTPNRTVGSLTNAGVVNVIYGRPLGLRPLNNQQWDQTQLSANGPAAAGNLFGSALAAADFNADGSKDLAVGATGQTVGGNAGAGAVNVIYGSRMGLKAVNSQLWTADSNGVDGSSNAAAQFGFALAAGDFNADSRMDLAIGAPGENIPAVGNQVATNNAGAVHILLGSSARLTSTNSQFWHENVAGLANELVNSGDRFGAALAVPTLRLSGIFLALVTIGFQEITYLVILNWIGLTRGPMGIPGVPPPFFFGFELRGNTGYYYLILALDVFTLFVLSRVVTSRLGRAFVSIREDELAAQASGIPTFRLKVLSFVVATFFAGLAGAFFAHHARFVSADSFRLDETFLILTMLIVGGMGSFLGPVIGAIALVILPEASRFLAEYRGVVYGLVLIGVILFRPEGVAGVPGIIQPRGLLDFKPAPPGDGEPAR
jgi:ABC-type branched-subunit amino acid transport system permease subunit